MKYSISEACPLACKMAREYVERSVYLSKEYKGKLATDWFFLHEHLSESYLMQYKDWIDKFDNYVSPLSNITCPSIIITDCEKIPL